MHTAAHAPDPQHPDPRAPAAAAPDGAGTPGTPGASGAPGPAAPPPVRRLTVLHDPGCLLCRHLGAWLAGRRQLVPLEFVTVASAEARRRFPGVDHDASLGEITVVADTGEVWTGPHAFVVCLWALADHRPLARRLGSPAGLPFARGAAFAASKYRAATRGRAVPGAQGAPGAAPRGRGGLPGPGCGDGSCRAPG
ncbi:DCC1-like thiol-disulfide oxidoreductase family protein [Streptomyces sp. NPDC001380]|uniref:DCC1-like thiol-disulfide oxidoreductase family protein n=1 Tax=Streptomyces sp. NPDC001380 TaxID=3364566 RepID=UPI0036C94D6F